MSNPNFERKDCCMNDIQKMMYQSVVLIRNNEVNLRWTRNQLFFLINSAGLSLVLTQLKVSDTVYGLACLGGLFLSFLWVQVIFLIRRWVDYWDSMLRALESLDGNPITVFSGAAWQKTRYTRLTSTWVLTSVTMVFIAAWTGMFVYWLYKFIKP